MVLPLTDVDHDRDNVINAILKLDATGVRIAAVLRSTLDQLYDGQRTGRYYLDQLHKTEKTHCGTLVEINLHREFQFDDGKDLDYQIEGIDVDCKYSQDLGGWMIPPEAVDKLCLLVWANDKQSAWNIGLVRAKSTYLNNKGNRDVKCTLNSAGRLAIHWLYNPAQNNRTSTLSKLEHLPLPPNILLQLPKATVDGIMNLKHGTKRLNELFRVAIGMRVGRGVVATVAQQADFMKRVRENGGARTALRPEGIVILGQFGSHVAIASSLGVPAPEAGESVSVRVCPASNNEVGAAKIEGKFWRKANPEDPVFEAPKLPTK